MTGKFGYFLILLPFFMACKTDKNAFEKIIFHTSGCFGYCPTYHLEIRSDQSTRLFAEKLYKRSETMPMEQDYTAQGYFVGKANFRDFKKLDTIIRNMGLDTLDIGNQTCCDGVLYTITIYYDGKKKEFKTMFPEEKALDLINTLKRMLTSGDFKRVEKGFKLEGVE